MINSDTPRLLFPDPSTAEPALVRRAQVNTSFRNWHPEIYAEVFVRLNDHGQSVAHVARMVGLSHMQIDYFQRQLDASPTSLPRNLRFPTAEQFDEARERLAAEIPTEKIRGRGRPPKMPPTGEYLAEIEGCINLAKQISTVFPKISAVRFLRDCLDHARTLKVD